MIDTTVALLGLIATIDLAQFAITLEHRGRLSKVESAVEEDVKQIVERALDEEQTLADGGVGRDE